MWITRCPVAVVARSAPCSLACWPARRWSYRIFVFYVLAVLPSSSASLTPSCSGHGTFSLWHGTLSCLCERGWQGRTCADPVCEPTCAHGSCAAPSVCLCAPGFSGPTCSDHACPSSCGQHGVCMNGTCACDLLWTGSGCDVPACVNDCSGHGTCRHNVCICDKGWVSLDCSVASCPQDCSAHGDCRADGSCRCHPGWTGDACDVINCDPGCGPHGQCAGGECVCATGWQGDACDAPVELCIDSDCGWPHGQCSSKGSGCICAPGWQGPSCSERTCPSGCSKHGSCAADGHCMCSEGWVGNDCSQAACPGTPICSGRGECVDQATTLLASWACHCFDGYGGDACEVRPQTVARHDVSAVATCHDCLTFLHLH